MNTALITHNLPERPIVLVALVRAAWQQGWRACVRFG